MDAIEKANTFNKDKNKTYLIPVSDILDKKYDEGSKQ